MKKVRKLAKAELSWEEIGYLCEGFSFASRPMKQAVLAITAQYSLGPRGAWILRLIAGGGIFPSDLTGIFHVGRSLISAELARLVEAGLITCERGDKDRRQIELAVTPLGERADARVKAAVSKMVHQRLGSYSREEVLLCARMLHDFIGAETVKTRSR